MLYLPSYAMHCNKKPRSAFNDFSSFQHFSPSTSSAPDFGEEDGWDLDPRRICPDAKFRTQKGFKTLKNTCPKIYQNISLKFSLHLWSSNSIQYLSAPPISKDKSNKFNKQLVNGGAAVAQWIRFCLPSCRPRFESQAHHLCFYQFEFELWHVEKTKNKQKKRPGLVHLKNRKWSSTWQCLN